MHCINWHFTYLLTNTMSQNVGSKNNREVSYKIQWRPSSSWLLESGLRVWQFHVYRTDGFFPSEISRPIKLMASSIFFCCCISSSFTYTVAYQTQSGTLGLSVLWNESTLPKTSRLHQADPSNRFLKLEPMANARLGGFSINWMAAAQLSATNIHQHD